MTKKRKREMVKKRLLAVLLAILAIIIAAGICGVYDSDFPAQTESDSSESFFESERVQESKETTETETEFPSAEISESATETEPTEPSEPSKPSVPAPPKDIRGKKVYLTFDDGPSANTPEILEILKKYNVKATFFVINAGGYNRYMKDIVQNGHAIGLHSYSHNYSVIYSSQQAYYEDLAKIDAVVKKETGVETHLLRFPGGSSNTISRKYCKGIMSDLSLSTAERGYTYFDWNSDSGDAIGNNIEPQVLVKKSIESVESANGGAILLMHDTAMKKTTAEALPKIIETLLERGCTFEVLSKDAPHSHHKIAN